MSGDQLTLHFLSDYHTRQLPARPPILLPAIITVSASDWFFIFYFQFISEQGNVLFAVFCCNTLPSAQSSAHTVVTRCVWLVDSAVLCIISKLEGGEMVYKQLGWQLTASLYDILLLQLLFWINVNSISEVEVDCWLMRWYHSQQVIILLIATTYHTMELEPALFFSRSSFSRMTCLFHIWCDLFHHLILNRKKAKCQSDAVDFF